MKFESFANRLSLWIMAVLIVMSTAVMTVIYKITRDSMAAEVVERYQGIIMHSNEKIRGVLSDVYVAAINNITDLAHPDFSVADLHRPCMTA